MKSMTGYGKFTVAENDRIITIEIKTVNNRFLEINHRLPKALSFCEDIVRNSLKSALSRGNVDVYFDYKNNSEKSREVSVDYALANELIKNSVQLSEKYAITNNFGVNELMRYPDVLSVTESGDNEELVRDLVKKCINGAVENLNAMREKEGATIKQDLKLLIDSIEEYLEQVKLRAPLVVQEYREKISARISEILQGVEIDETKLLNEVAFFADKADVNEEMQRLTSHIKQFNDILESDEAQGRKLDFLSQEINREINTTGSKSNDKILTSYVIAMKNQLEKIKEQIRNVE